MTFSTLNTKIRTIVNEVIKERERFTLELALDAITLVSRRVQREGEKSTGEKFDVPYSRNALPGYYFPKDFVRYARKNKLPTTYENYRKWKGLPTNIRNLTNTNQMWSSIRPKVIENTVDRTIVEISADSKDMQERVDQNSKREGTNILRMSKDERAFISKKVKDWTEELLNDGSNNN